jgi:hypothetical protein
MSWLWRRKVKIFASLADSDSLGLNEKGMARRFGKSWAYKLRSQIMGINLSFSRVQYPDRYTYFLDKLAFHRATPASLLSVDESQVFSAQDRAEFEEEQRDMDRAIYVVEQLLNIEVNREEEKG